MSEGMMVGTRVTARPINIYPTLAGSKFDQHVLVISKYVRRLGLHSCSDGECSTQRPSGHHIQGAGDIEHTKPGYIVSVIR